MQGAYDAALAGGCNLFDTAESCAAAAWLLAAAGREAAAQAARRPCAAQPRPFSPLRHACPAPAPASRRRRRRPAGRLGRVGAVSGRLPAGAAGAGRARARRGIQVPAAAALAPARAAVHHGGAPGHRSARRPTTGCPSASLPLPAGCRVAGLGWERGTPTPAHHAPQWSAWGSKRWTSTSCTPRQPRSSRRGCAAAGVTACMVGGAGAGGAMGQRAGPCLAQPSIPSRSAPAHPRARLLPSLPTCPSPYPSARSDIGQRPGPRSGQRPGPRRRRQQLRRGAAAGDAPAAGGARRAAGREPGGWVGRRGGVWMLARGPVQGLPRVCSGCSGRRALGAVLLPAPAPRARSPPPQVEFSLCHALPERSGLLEACAELGVRWARAGGWGAHRHRPSAGCL